MNAKVIQTWKVKLEGKVVGEIRLAVGYQYIPTGSKVGGEIFPSFSQCRASLSDESIPEHTK